VVHALDGIPPADLDARIARQGIAMVCPMRAAGCIDVAMRRASRASIGRRVEAEVTRRYFNVEGDAGRYVIVTARAVWAVSARVLGNLPSSFDAAVSWIKVA
jgi:hypothetical protein